MNAPSQEMLSDRPLRHSSTPDLLRRLNSWKQELKTPRLNWPEETVKANIEVIECELRTRGRLPEALL